MTSELCPFEPEQSVAYQPSRRDSRFPDGLPAPCPVLGQPYRIAELVPGGYLRLHGFEHLSRHALHWSDFSPIGQSFDTTSPYTRDELIAARDGRWPRRGDRCDCCGNMIPRFAELTPQDETRIVQMVSEGQVTQARRELAACTGAPSRFTKIWALHSGQPRSRFAGPPCPKCGKPLISANSKQCLHCHEDWH